MSNIRVPPQTQVSHPLADLFPLIEGEEFDELVADVCAHGVREPVWLYQDKVLDGRNRYLAAQAAGVECPTRVYDGDDPVGFVISLNLKRRHLDASQRAMIAAKLATLQQGARTDLSPIGERSQATAAKALNVGKRSVERAKIVRDQGSPELVKAVEAGEVSVSAAVDSIRPRSPAAPRRETAKKVSFDERRFERTLSCIRESCESTVDMALPRALTREGAAEAINSLSKSAEQISNLLQRLRAQRRLLEPNPDDGLGIPAFLRRGAA